MRFPLLLFLPGIAAALLRVPEDVATIQAGIDLAIQDDTLLIAPGQWMEQLTIPPGRLTIASNYLMSHDSTDIVNTVLDGMLERTIMTVNMNSESSLELNGLTFTRGEGGVDSHGIVAGALHINHVGQIKLKNLVFHGNRAPIESASIRYIGVGEPSSEVRFYLHNINCYDNEPNVVGPSPGSGMMIAYAKSIYADRLRISPQYSSLSTQYFLVATDTLIASDCRFTNGVMLNAPFGFSTSDLNYNGGYVELNDIYITDNTFPMGGGFAVDIANGGYGKIHNVHLDRNQFPDGNMHFDFRVRGSYDADSLFICDNRSNRSYPFFNSDSRGNIRDLFVIGNHMGDSVSFTPTFPGVNAQIFDVNINGALYQDNIIERTATGSPNSEYVAGGSLLYLSRQFADTLTYKNLRFINNQHIDHDTYRMSDVYMGRCQPNRGRLIYGVDYSSPTLVVLDSCVFIGNRQPNIVPEVEPQDELIDVNAPGDNVYIYNAGSQFGLRVSNIFMRDCDDGGINVSGTRYLCVENVEIIDCRRHGLGVGSVYASEPVILRNIFISGLQQQASYSSLPFRSCYQNAMSLGFGPNVVTDISNLTIMNCNVPFLIRSYDYDHDRRIKNSIFHDNTYDYQFEHPNGAGILFDHCVLPVINAGIGNLLDSEVNLDFDVDLGPPWLPDYSPCVDAGDPSSNYDDLEDPNRTGMALWPSHGTVVNDMGYTGGPGARGEVMDWSGLPEWQPPVHPNEFQLGTPWPNPFNPMTQISVELTRPSLAQLVVHNVLGQQVAVLHDGLLPAGRHVIRWDAHRQASGIYFLTLTVDLEKTQSRAVTLLR